MNQSMNPRSNRRAMRLALTLFFCSGLVRAQNPVIVAPPDEADSSAVARRQRAPGDGLTAAEWNRVDAAVDRALAFLAAQQQEDGSFPSTAHGQPAVTSLCLLAFLAHGRHPDEGEYGPALARAANFILTCQKPSGLIAKQGPDGVQIEREVNHLVGKTAAYNHAISSLTLSELYGMSQSAETSKFQRAIDKSLAASLQMQRWPKDFAHDRGGWRYVDDWNDVDSDLSLTGWQLMFLRSARNAGFNVPKQAIDDAVSYVRGTFDRNFGTFNYVINRGPCPSRGMAGAGILALGHAGFHESFEAQHTGRWLMQFSFDVYNDGAPFNDRDRYHYSLFNCCQGMYQLGSPYWEEFFPRTARAVLAHQQSDGSWEAEQFQEDRSYGNSYSTALVVLSLGAPNQLLPIFQR